MNARSVVRVLALIPACAFAQGTHVGTFDGSYAQCILKEMPGVANDAIAQQVIYASGASQPGCRQTRVAET